MAVATREPESPHDSTSIPALLKELRDETSLLLRQEVALAKQELSEKTARISRNAGYLVAGGLVAYAGAVLLVGAVAVIAYGLLTAAGVSHMVAGWLAPLLVGGVVTAIGAGLVGKAINTLRNVTLVPERTVETLQNDKEFLKEKIAS